MHETKIIAFYASAFLLGFSITALFIEDDSRWFVPVVVAAWNIGVLLAERIETK